MDTALVRADLLNAIETRSQLRYGPVITVFYLAGACGLVHQVPPGS